MVYELDELKALCRLWTPLVRFAGKVVFPPCSMNPSDHTRYHDAPDFHVFTM